VAAGELSGRIALVTGAGARRWRPTSPHRSRSASLLRRIDGDATGQIWSFADLPG
jgi:hypothetical protein